MLLQVGQTITAPFLPGPAEVKQFEPRRGYYRLEVLLQDGSNQYFSRNIFEHQLDQITILNHNAAALAANAEDFFYLIEAHRIRLAYQFDPQLAVSISQVDPLPHQIEAVYDYALTSPRMRFLIADDPGAGKTVMAGLIFKELQYRRLARRVLIVAPGHLKYQWQREMKEKFGAAFAIVDRARIESSWGENVWEERDHCITSIDFVKQDEVRATLRGSNWDLVIIDEDFEPLYLLDAPQYNAIINHFFNLTLHTVQRLRALGDEQSAHATADLAREIMMNYDNDLAELMQRQAPSPGAGAYDPER